MFNERRNIIHNLVVAFAKMAKISDEYLCEKTTDDLCKLDDDELIDRIIIILSRLHNNGRIQLYDIISNVGLVLELNSKYSTVYDLINRYKELRRLNVIHSQMNLEENHRLILEVFDRFSSLIGTHFDCYYTGGLVGYVASGQKLKRYHGDIDLLINEAQLEELKTIVDGSKDFTFRSLLDNKGKNGHEFIIEFNGTPIHIGLFLFERTASGEVAEKSYYYSGEGNDKKLLSNEYHYSQEYSSLAYDTQIRMHNGIPYRMCSFERIVFLKRHNRPKDIFDVSELESYVDKSKIEQLESVCKKSYFEENKPTLVSPVKQLEDRIKKQVNQQEDISDRSTR